VRRRRRGRYQPVFIHQQRFAASGGYIDAEEKGFGHMGRSRWDGNQGRLKLNILFKKGTINSAWHVPVTYSMTGTIPRRRIVYEVYQFSPGP
jgi:hypothetical protein